jgi:hypothetical protein
MGRATKPVGMVAYASSEQGNKEVARRLDRLLAHGDVGQRVRVWRHADLKLHPKHLPVWQRLISRLVGERVLLVIDPMRDYIASGSEKDDEVIRIVKETCRALIAHRPGLSVILLHHNTKASSFGDDRDSSGSGAISAMADVLVQWSIDRPKDAKDGEEEEDDDVLALAGVAAGKAVIKSRSDDRLVDRWRWSSVTGLFTRVGAEREAIVSALSSGPLTLHEVTDVAFGAGAAKVRSAGGSHYPNVDATRKLLRALGAVEMTNPAPGGVSVWTLDEGA